jgi:hypothetical protein
LAYQPFTIEAFGSLNLRADPLELGSSGATDLLNVDFDRPGSVRTRPGSTKLNSSAFTAGTVQRVFEWPETRAPLRYSLSGTTVTIDVLDSGGTDSVFTTWTGAGVGGTYFGHAFIGTATTKYMFIAQQIVPGHRRVVRRVDSLGTNAASVGSCFCIAAWQERLILANIETAPAGAVTGDSVVFFSGAGTPETFSATDFIRPGLNDGEPITALVAWHELLFIFKQTRMFIVYGTSVASDGSAVFNSGPSTCPPGSTGHVAAGEFPVVAGPDAVYMALADGIYVSTGGPPWRFRRPCGHCSTRPPQPRSAATRTSASTSRADGSSLATRTTRPARPARSSSTRR